MLPKGENMASPLIKQHIERHSRILAILRQIEAEPQLDEALREIYCAPKPALPAPWMASPPDAGTGNGRGQLKRMVLEVLQKAAQPLSTEMVADQMRANGFNFKTESPTISINEALNTWREDGRAQVDHLEGRKQFWIAVPPVREGAQ
jgi:hypothetical protein